MRVIAVVALLAACSGKTEQAPEPAPGAPAKPPARIAPDAASCGDEVARFKPWLTDLASEGANAITAPSNLVYVTLDAPPGQLETAPIVTLTRDEISFQGELITTMSSVPSGLPELAEILMHPARPELILLQIDETVPWSAVAGVAIAAMRAGARRLGFIFHAKTTKTALPDAYSIELVSKGRFDPGDPFQSCEQARVLMKELGELETGDKGKLLVEKLPGAIEACGCQLDLAAVRRWLWLAWHREEPGAPLTAVTLQLARRGPRLSVPPGTPWSSASRAVVDAAGRGTPVHLE